MRPSLRLRRLALQEVGLRAGLAVNPVSPRQPRWQTALTGRDSAQRSALRLVLAGSRNVERVEPPANAAVLIDALTGELLVHQRKVHPFNFSPADVELWGLGGRFEALIDEDLSRGERLCVIEAGGVRLVILVCEDLARLHAFPLLPEQLPTAGLKGRAPWARWGRDLCRRRTHRVRPTQERHR